MDSVGSGMSVQLTWLGCDDYKEMQPSVFFNRLYCDLTFTIRYPD